MGGGRPEEEQQEPKKSTRIEQLQVQDAKEPDHPPAKQPRNCRLQRLGQPVVNGMVKRSGQRDGTEWSVGWWRPPPPPQAPLGQPRRCVRVLCAHVCGCVQWFVWVGACVCVCERERERESTKVPPCIKDQSGLRHLGQPVRAFARTRTHAGASSVRANTCPCAHVHACVRACGRVFFSCSRV